MKYRAYTLGCKVNQFETQALEGLLEERGIFPAQAGERADLVIVNTCAVTSESARKSRQALRRLKAENPDAVTAVCGCLSQLSREGIEELGADVVHGSGDKKHFFEDIMSALSRRERAVFVDEPFKRRIFEELPGGAFEGRARATLKIQDGCANFCSYCVIPYTRGRPRSLPKERCAAQCAALSEKGVGELVMTGIEISSYGVDLEPKSSLIEALEAMAAVSGAMRLRLGSLEPRVITREFAERLRATGKICPHFHLSLQSGCDRTLKEMNRRYDTRQFFEATEILREFFPECGMTADLIVGFPGETEEDFAKTLSFIEKCAFSSMHIFPYSARPGTSAAQLPGQLTNAVKTARAKRARELAERMEEAFLRSCVGKTLPVVFETCSDGVWEGHADNYALVQVMGEQGRGHAREIFITGLEGNALVGVSAQEQERE
ncbi:MAG: tRNA (N(6)-L-threonylcarbamoyladenosine(37)-C(2))-methylthiotransferase MtaB [Oscillospiraceae bacterium]|jgi:threonylcarbamoyladenosine tRNA methylthiotransferase MtaB|nr:tRNA (N(6)-L-threonylcarbamoyladenosine(37)-C(2))-methylthiotransferase MtaB [Oscillospiraceae bacterium]